MNIDRYIKSFIYSALSIGFVFPATAASEYPTSVIAEYVYGCMKANGETRDMLQRCSCSIDIVASVMPYDRYVMAETFKEMGRIPGEKGVLFRQSAPARTVLAELKRAQAEADVRCF